MRIFEPLFFIQRSDKDSGSLSKNSALAFAYEAYSFIFALDLRGIRVFCTQAHYGKCDCGYRRAYSYVCGPGYKACRRSGAQQPGYSRRDRALDRYARAEHAAYNRRGKDRRQTGNRIYQQRYAVAAETRRYRGQQRHRS